MQLLTCRQIHLRGLLENVSHIGGLTKPRTPKQKAKTFDRWRQRLTGDKNG
jgi:hypothetical protein